VIAGSRPGRLRAAAPLLVAAFVAVAFVAVACSPDLTTTPSAPASPKPATPPAASAGSPSTRASPGASSAAASSLIAIDPSLLKLLPAQVGGIPLVGSPEAAADPASDPSLAAHAQSIAVALAVDQASGDLVVASVVKLKPGVFSDEFFRDWRDSFDEGVCGQAGGVVGNAQATIDGRTVYIGTCEGGVHTYHVHLEGPDVIISLNAVGEGRMGEQLMESLPD
jgi:hypothetical protein